MATPETTSPADLPLTELAERNRDAIVTAVADHFHERLDSLRLVPRLSFRSDVDGTASFWVQNESGAFGVNGTINGEGNITEITVGRIPLSETPAA